MMRSRRAALPQTYVSLGPKRCATGRTRSAAGAAPVHRVGGDGQRPVSAAKEVAAAVSDALVDADLTLSRGRLMWLISTVRRPRRGQPGARAH